MEDFFKGVWQEMQVFAQTDKEKARNAVRYSKLSMQQRLIRSAYNGISRFRKENVCPIA